MVFGGYPNGSNEVTLIAVEDDVTVPECHQNLEPHPKILEGTCQATLTESEGWHKGIFSFALETYFTRSLTGKLPHVCGGEDLNTGYSKECWRYHPGEKNMNQIRRI